nr:Alpha-L-arabinofuranosidase B [Ipomoea batatas]
MRCLLMLGVVMFSFMCGFVLSKECTNVPTQLSSHTLRYELLSSKNESWRKEMFGHYHLTPTDDSAWSNLLPRKMLKEEDEFDWMMMYKKIKKSGGVKGVGGFLNEVSLNDVRLDPNSIHGRAQQTNLEYLLMLDVDRLVWSFRKTAGLETPGEPYGGWEGATVELRGHFVGHYLSASAQMWASTHNDTLKQKMSAVVSSLSACQEKMGSGYLSAFPSELFDRFEDIKPVWAPYYTIHKADPKHLLLAHLFDKPCFLGLLAVKADDLSGFHTNTHIPIVIGSQMRYEITGDPIYKKEAVSLMRNQQKSIFSSIRSCLFIKEIGTYFMDIVNTSHAYATGGTSVSEFWSDPKRLASTLQTENEESCTTYNMLKVSRNLFRWTKEMAYADYYERALTNGVLSIQRGTDPGVMVYMLPLHPGASKAKSYHGWGTKFDSFWCCYGTGIESFSKLGDSIYFEEQGEVPGIYIIQYISSSLDWKSGQITLRQSVDPVGSQDNRLLVTITITSKQSSSVSSTLHLRVPIWTNASGSKASLNGEAVSLPPPGNFLSITRSWASGDKITLELPMSIRTEAIKDERSDYASVQAILYGPYLLAGLSNGDWAIKDSPSDWIAPVATQNSHLISLTQESGNDVFVLTNSNQSINMDKYPETGTDSAIRATFRLISKDDTSRTHSDFIGKLVTLEPFDYPGTVVMHQGKDNNLVVTSSSDDSGSSAFLLSTGLDGKDGTVSLESTSQKGCYVYSGVDYKPGLGVKLSCMDGSSDAGFKQAASFKLESGITEYHPISFVAKGPQRNFVLAPLLSLRDESYTVYFDFQS